MIGLPKFNDAQRTVDMSGQEKQLSGEDWAALKKEGKRRRANNRKRCPDRLTQANIRFDTRNEGAHLIVYADSGTIDYWPGTGLWIDRKTHRTGRGVKGLIRFAAP
jgi:hypothetical protein